MGKNQENWLAIYEALKAYIDEHHHLPDKHRVECRALLNWAKYQRKRIKDGSLDEEKIRLFNELMGQRSPEHTGGRRKADDKGR